MFISRKGLMKLMTQAYKGAGGLKVKNDGVGLSITGSSWSAYFIWTDIPKEVMGDLISLVGRLPEKGECYEASPEGNQSVMYIEERNAMEAGDEAGPELVKLPLILMNGGEVALLQNPEPGTHDITLVSNYAMGLIRPNDVGDGEEYPDGPLSGGGMIEGRFLAAATWKNNMMGFSIGFVRPINEYINDIAHILDNHLLWRESNGRAAEVFGK